MEAILAQPADRDGHFPLHVFGTADVLSKALGLRRGDSYQARVDKYLAQTRAALGEAPFVATWAEGRAMPLEQAIDYAMKVDT